MSPYWHITHKGKFLCITITKCWTWVLIAGGREVGWGGLAHFLLTTCKHILSTYLKSQLMGSKWSWSFICLCPGIGSGSAPLAQCVELASRPSRIRQWKHCQHLIIDEISMIDADFFDKLEAVARSIKKNDRPFGGIHLILSGDFLQLPPVAKYTEKKKFSFQVIWYHKITLVSPGLIQLCMGFWGGL